MIQPLRKMHRTIFFALGIALPVLFIAGLASRHAPLPAVGTVEGKLAQRNGGTEFVLNRGSSKFRVRLLENRKAGPEREFLAIPDSGFLAADVFVYWSETQPGAFLSPNAKLLGKLGPGELYRILSGSGGYFVLYSVAQNEVLGSVPVGAGT
jgi:hypothetical protein